MVFEGNGKGEFVMYDRQFFGSFLDELSFYLLNDQFQLTKGISASLEDHQFYNPTNGYSFNNDEFIFSSGMIKNQNFDSLSIVTILFDFFKESIIGFSHNDFEGAVLVESIQNRKLIIHDLNNNSINLHLMEEEQFLSNFKIVFDDLSDFRVNDIHFLDKKNIIILLSGLCLDNICSVILKINLTDNSWDSKIINDCNLLEINSSFNSFITCVGYTSKSMIGSNNDRDGIIVEFDDDLLPKKSILIYADNFRPRRITLVPTTNQEYLLAYATFSRYPVIFVKLDQNFELVFHQGLDFLSPELIIDNNKLYIFSHEVNDQSILTKTNLDLALNDCPNYAACLKIREVEFSTQDVNLTFSEIDSLERFDLDWEFTTTGFSPYECEDNPLPSAFFSLPDTICIGDCIQTADTDNQYAQYREWYLQTPTKNITTLDSLILDLCFKELGTYNLKQTIWVLGCEYDFEKDIEVIDKINVRFEDQLVCSNETYIEIINDGNQNLTTNWSDGSLGLEREILESGYYEVTITNDFCDTIVGANITLLGTEINIEEILILPEDILICNEDLPFSFSIPFFENEAIYMDGVAVDFDSIRITQSGQYIFSTIIEGCTYEKELQVVVDSCFTQIYFPTAFSPNGDGINDSFKPLGENFKPLHLQVFNRWGAEISTQVSSWDGTHQGKQLQGDVFFYIFTYENALTGAHEQKTGCLTLIR